jgi:hypothetical protein
VKVDIEIRLRDIPLEQAQDMLRFLVEDAPTEVPFGDGVDAPEESNEVVSIFPELEPGFTKTDPPTRELGLRLAEYAATLPGATAPMPEDTSFRRGPRYFRLTRHGRAYAYCWVRRVSLRLELALGEDAAATLGPGVRVKRVKPENRFKLEVLVYDTADLQLAYEAIRTAHAAAEREAA